MLCKGNLDSSNFVALAWSPYHALRGIVLGSSISISHERLFNYKFITYWLLESTTESWYFRLRCQAHVQSMDPSPEPWLLYVSPIDNDREIRANFNWRNINKQIQATCSCSGTHHLWQSDYSSQSKSSCIARRAKTMLRLSLSQGTVVIYDCMIQYDSDSFKSSPWIAHYVFCWQSKRSWQITRIEHYVGLTFLSWHSC